MRLRGWGLEFGVWGQDWGLGFRVEGLGLGSAEGEGCRAESWEIVQVLRFWFLVLGFGVQGRRPWVERFGAGC